MVHISTLCLSFLTISRSCAPTFSDSDGAGDDFVLQHDADNEEDKVEQEHEKSQELAHFPLASPNGEDDKEEHEEEEDDGAEQAIAAHLYWFEVIDDIVDEPGEWQTGGGIGEEKDKQKKLFGFSLNLNMRIKQYILI